jgi:hypothetical protein
MLPIILRMLGAARANHERKINGQQDDEGGYDSDGSPIGPDIVTSQLTELVCTLVENPRFRRSLLPELDHIAQMLVASLQVTDEQLSAWADDLNQYVIEEGDESYEYTVRLSAQVRRTPPIPRTKLQCPLTAGATAARAARDLPCLRGQGAQRHSASGAAVSAGGGGAAPTGGPELVEAAGGGAIGHGCHRCYSICQHRGSGFTSCGP